MWYLIVIAVVIFAVAMIWGRKRRSDQLAKTLEELILAKDSKGLIRELEREPDLAPSLILSLKFPKKNTPLLYAALYGDAELLRILLKCGADLYTKNKEKCNVLHLACLSGSLSAVQVLIRNFPLQMQEAAKEKTEQGYTPLHLAAIRGYDTIIEALISELKVEVDVQDDQGNTPLIVAACNGHPTSLQVLINSGKASIITQNSKQRSALYLSTRNGNTKIMNILLTARRESLKKEQQNQPESDGDDADEKDLILLRDISGYQALHAACSTGNLETVELLLKEGAPIDSQAADGSTPLMCSCVTEEHTDVVKCLLSHNANVSIQNQFGLTIVHNAALRAQNQVLKEIITYTSQRAEQSVFALRDFDGLFPLHQAIQGALRNNAEGVVKETVRILIEEAKVDVNCMDYADSTPLHYLCCTPDTQLCLELVDMLLKYGSNPSLEDVYGWTPIHFLENKTSPVALEIKEKVTTFIKEHFPHMMSTYDPNKKRDTSKRTFHLRKGPHNQFSSETLRSVLNGETTMMGIAKKILNSIYDKKPLKIVVLTGAGISVSCGIPDFRSPVTGLFSNPGYYNAFSSEGFFSNPHVFYDLLKNMFFPIVKGDVQPSLTHHFLALLERKGLLQRLYTQNIDMLEKRANISPDLVVESHGSLESFYCTNCKAKMEDIPYVWKQIMKGELPECYECDYLVRPSVVFYGEPLPQEFFAKHRADMKKCDLLIVMGSSLVVYPFAMLPNEVSLLTPRLLINKNLVGPFQLYEEQEKTDIVNKYNYRDVAWLGECDAGVLEFASLLGWKEELLLLKKNYTPPPPPF